MDERSLNTMRQQFALEMAVILDIDQEEAEEKIDKALQISIEKL